MPMSLRRKTKPVLSSKDRQFIGMKVAARYFLETLENWKMPETSGICEKFHFSFHYFNPLLAGAARRGASR